MHTHVNVDLHRHTHTQKKESSLSHIKQKEKIVAFFSNTSYTIKFKSEKKEMLVH